MRKGRRGMKKNICIWRFFLHQYYRNAAYYYKQEKIHDPYSTSNEDDSFPKQYLTKRDNFFPPTESANRINSTHNVNMRAKQQQYSINLGNTQHTIYSSLELTRKYVNDRCIMGNPPECKYSGMSKYTCKCEIKISSI